MSAFHLNIYRQKYFKASCQFIMEAKRSSDNLSTLCTLILFAAPNTWGILSTRHVQKKKRKQEKQPHVFLTYVT